jgi:hypothetical protein
VSLPTVNPGLTPDHLMGTRPGPGTRRRRNRVENDDYAAFTQRVIAAHGRRIAQGDIEGLTTLAALAVDIDHALHEAITSLREAGHSWTDIGDQLGVTRQAAQQRWGGNQP